MYVLRKIRCSDLHGMVDLKRLELSTSRMRTERSAEWYTKRALEYRFFSSMVPRTGNALDQQSIIRLDQQFMGGGDKDATIYIT